MQLFLLVVSLHIIVFAIVATDAFLLLPNLQAQQAIHHCSLLIAKNDDHNDDNPLPPPPPSSTVSRGKMTPQQVLLAFVKRQFGAQADRRLLPCGLDGISANDQEILDTLVQTLEQDDDKNFLLQTFNGKITGKQVVGSWQLLYTSSRTMRINKSLSGLGRSSSDMANFCGLQLNLRGSEFLGQMEFIEQIGRSSLTRTTTTSTDDDDDDNNDDDVLEVNISGEWMLEPETNPFTGAPTTALRINPESVAYGGVTKAKADDLNSLGPIKLLDILYLDDDLLIVRGNVNTESIFIFERI